MKQLRVLFYGNYSYRPDRDGQGTMIEWESSLTPRLTAGRFKFLKATIANEFSFIIPYEGSKTKWLCVQIGHDTILTAFQNEGSEKIIFYLVARRGLCPCCFDGTPIVHESVLRRYRQRKEGGII